MFAELSVFTETELHFTFAETKKWQIYSGLSRYLCLEKDLEHPQKLQKKRILQKNMLKLLNTWHRTKLSSKLVPAKI